MPLVNRTRATFRSAEFGFFGVVVYTRRHTPRRCGLPFSAGVGFLAILSWRPVRTSCWIVGTTSPLLSTRRPGRVSRSSGWFGIDPASAPRAAWRPTPGVGHVGPIPRGTVGTRSVWAGAENSHSPCGVQDHLAQARHED